MEFQLARRYQTDDFEPSEEEIEAARIVGEGGQRSQGIGSAIGTVAGAGLGALGFLAGPVVGAGTLGLGASLGGSLGGMAGSAAAEGDLQNAEETLADGAKGREKRIAYLNARRSALQALINEGR